MEMEICIVRHSSCGECTDIHWLTEWYPNSVLSNNAKVGDRQVATR